MPTNPLDGAGEFLFTLSNPNPTSSKTKEGPIYRVSVEVDRDTWDCFMDAETKGMVIECRAHVTHRNGEADVIHEKGGPMSIRSDALARDPEFREYIGGGDVNGARQYIRSFCKVKSRKDIDHDAEAAMRFHKLLSQYLQWGEKHG